MLEGQTKDTSLKRLISSFNSKAMPIANFHEELLTKLSSVSTVFLNSYGKGEDYTIQMTDTVGSVFVSARYQLLVYGPFLVQCQNLMSRIEEMLNNTFMSEKINELENFMKLEMVESKDSSRRTSFFSLLTFPMQHLLRYTYQHFLEYCIIYLII